VAMASRHPCVKHQSLTGGVAVLRLRCQCGHGRGARVQRARPAALGLHALGEPECQASLDLRRRGADPELVGVEVALTPRAGTCLGSNAS
jgi:hypothetical protein